MKHSLQLKLSQHLTLTPQLQQSIRLLQLSTVELNQELERHLAETPARARMCPARKTAARTARRRRTAPRRSPSPRPGPWATSAARSLPASPRTTASGDEHSTGSSSRRDDDDRDDFTQFAAAEPTLHEHLLQQISLTDSRRATSSSRSSSSATWTRTATSSRSWRSCASRPSPPCPTWRSKSCRSRCAMCTTSSPRAWARARCRRMPRAAARRPAGLHAPPRQGDRARHAPPGRACRARLQPPEAPARGDRRRAATSARWC